MENLLKNIFRESSFLLVLVIFCWTNSLAQENESIDFSEYCDACDYIVTPEGVYDLSDGDCSNETSIINVCPNETIRIRREHLINLAEGSIICLKGHFESELQFWDIRPYMDLVTGEHATQCFEGTYNTDHYIQIRNIGGQVTIRSETSNAMTFFGSQFIEITGLDDNENYDYGIKIEEAGYRSGMQGIAIANQSSFFHIHHVEIANVGFAGIMAKTDPNCQSPDDAITCNNFTMYDIDIHDNYIHDAIGEAIYIGNSFFLGRVCPIEENEEENEEEDEEEDEEEVILYPHSIEGVKVNNNIIERTGWDGLQVGCAIGCTKIFGNIIRDYGYFNLIGQANGIQLGLGTKDAFCYNNFIDKGSTIGTGDAGNGIFCAGMGDSYIYNNIIIQPNEYGIYSKESITFNEFDGSCDYTCCYGEDPFSDANGSAFIHNTIIHPGDGGIKVENTALTNGYAYNNLIIRANGGFFAVPSDFRYCCNCDDNIDESCSVDDCNDINSQNNSLLTSSCDLFVNPSQGNYTPTNTALYNPNSILTSCIEDVILPTDINLNHDFFGNSRLTNPYFGAIQYVQNAEQQFVDCNQLEWIPSDITTYSNTSETQTLNAIFNEASLSFNVNLQEQSNRYIGFTETDGATTGDILFGYSIVWDSGEQAKIFMVHPDGDGNPDETEIDFEISCENVLLALNINTDGLVNYVIDGTIIDQFVTYNGQTLNLNATINEVIQGQGTISNISLCYTEFEIYPGANNQEINTACLSYEWDEPSCNVLYPENVTSFTLKREDCDDDDTIDDNGYALSLLNVAIEEASLSCIIYTSDESNRYIGFIENGMSPTEINLRYGYSIQRTDMGPQIKITYPDAQGNITEHPLLNVDDCEEVKLQIIMESNNPVRFLVNDVEINLTNISPYSAEYLNLFVKIDQATNLNTKIDNIDFCIPNNDCSPNEEDECQYVDWTTQNMSSTTNGTLSTLGLIGENWESAIASAPVEGQMKGKVLKFNIDFNTWERSFKWIGFVASNFVPNLNVISDEDFVFGFKILKLNSSSLSIYSINNNSSPNFLNSIPIDNPDPNETIPFEIRIADDGVVTYYVGDQIGAHSDGFYDCQDLKLYTYIKLGNLKDKENIEGLEYLEDVEHSAFINDISFCPKDVLPPAIDCFDYKWTTLKDLNQKGQSILLAENATEGYGAALLEKDLYEKSLSFNIDHSEKAHRWIGFASSNAQSIDDLQHGFLVKSEGEKPTIVYTISQNSNGKLEYSLVGEFKENLKLSLDVNNLGEVVYFVNGETYKSSTQYSGKPLDLFSRILLSSDGKQAGIYTVDFCPIPKEKAKTTTPTSEFPEKYPSISEIESVPNPFTTTTQLQFSINQVGWYHIQMYDTVGRLVHDAKQNLNTGNQIYYIQDTHLPHKGVYYVRIIAPDGMMKSIPIVKQ